MFEINLLVCFSFKAKIPSHAMLTPKLDLLFLNYVFSLIDDPFQDHFVSFIFALLIEILRFVLHPFLFDTSQT